MQNRNDMRFKISVVCVLISICSAILCSAANITLPDDSQVGTWGFSRKKRYLTFPSGSVVQLGYCLTIPSLIPQTVWFYGVTFGTNWEIPTNPLRLLFPKRSAVLHRRDRLSFYQKLLTMLNTMGLDGESCLLLALCESGQRPRGAKGSFLGEILHVVFTLPQRDANEWEASRDFVKYDRAHRTERPCSEIFPSCFKDPDVS